MKQNVFEDKKMQGLDEVDRVPHPNIPLAQNLFSEALCLPDIGELKLSQISST